jgi:hypothetical protein
MDRFSPRPKRRCGFIASISHLMGLDGQRPETPYLSESLQHTGRATRRSHIPQHSRGGDLPRPPASIEHCAHECLSSPEYPRSLRRPHRVQDTDTEYQQSVAYLNTHLRSFFSSKDLLISEPTESPIEAHTLKSHPTGRDRTHTQSGVRPRSPGARTPPW